MRQRCEYCGNWIDDTDETCPHCGAPNEHMMVSAEGVPKTIEELKAFCEAHHLPLEDMRFFVGEDFKEPRAFGIYQDGEDFVVYKNKANGERAVRYRGHDEAYAVNELYQKMKSEIANQRLYQAKKSEGGQRSAQPSQLSGKHVAAITVAFITVSFVAIGLLYTFMPFGAFNGYYDYNDTTYYCQNDDWYYFDTTTSEWVRDEAPPTTLTESADDYYTSSDWDGSGGATDFTESPYYVPSTDTNDDWDDDDWDWDSSDTWDSGGTDWDSDW